MCTSMTLQRQHFYFGRNLDLEYSFGERVVITPRHFPVSFRKAGTLLRHYALIGGATVAENMPLYAEAATEKGLCVAGLNFPEYAFYPEKEAAGKTGIAPFELPLWLLCQCADLAQAKELLAKTALIALPFSAALPLTPLHWHIADETGACVLECTREGMRVLENPVGVLTNSPPLDFHLINLRQFLNLTAQYPRDRFKGLQPLSPFGVGMGAMGLPGDFSPASRFIRGAFLLGNAPETRGEEECVGQFFHLLSGVAMTDGTVETKEGKYEKTRYSCCINASRGIYYYTTYENRRITGIDMKKENLEAEELKQFPLRRKEEIAWEN